MENKIAKDWVTKVVLGYIKSKRANATGISALALLYIPTFLQGRGMSENGALIVSGLVAAVVGLYLHSQGQADQGKAGVETALKRDILQTILPRMVRGKMDNFKDVMVSAGFDVHEADKLANALTQGEPERDPMADARAAASMGQAVQFKKPRAAQPPVVRQPIAPGNLPESEEAKAEELGKVIDKVSPAETKQDQSPEPAAAAPVEKSKPLGYNPLSGE